MKKESSQDKKALKKQQKVQPEKSEKKQTKVQSEEAKKKQSEAQSRENKKRHSKQQSEPKGKQTKVQSSGEEKKQSKTRHKEEEQKQISRKPEKVQDEKKQKRDWKEYVYNCPFLIAVTLTSLVVMIHSDEIGIRAVARQAQTFACRSYAKMPGEQETFSDTIIQDGIKNTGDIENMETDNAIENAEDTQAEQSGAEIDLMENSEENSLEKEENAGKCKGENNGLQDDNGLDEDDESTGEVVKTEKKPKGITRFEYYDPVPTESRYYKDAGKVALTTEYPYTKENISYFNDAAFLGDSRTLGISDYAGLEEADFYCDSGMTIFKILEESVTYQKTGNKVYMTEVLQEKQYGKIYIMLGMNELGYGDTEFYLDQYRQVLQQIREWQPGAIIYVMANLHVSREKNNPETEFNNLNINAKNAASASLANGTDVFYLDVNPIFTDEDGYLNAELTFDGVHLYAKHYDVWREFLLEHAVEPEETDPQVESGEILTD